MAGFVLLCAGFILITFVFLSLTNGRRRMPEGASLPPGPPGYPIVGNLLDIPPKHSWLKFKEWSDQYGSLYRLNLAGKEHYMISSEKIANDLLRERGTYYSSREQFPAAAKLLSDNLRPLFLPYNDVWRNGRKLMHHLTNSTVVKSYQPAQLLESTRMLTDLLRAPEQYEKWFERYSSGLIFRLAFGKRVETGDEEVVKRILHTVHTVERVASPGAYLVDAFPSLMYVPTPLAPFKKELNQLHQAELDLFRSLLEDVRKAYSRGEAPNCWEREFLDRQPELGLSDDEGAYVVGTLFEAGSGTTSSAMMSFMFTMLHHPEWYKKLQNEVDSVCGAERLPTLDDSPQMPIVRAVVKEVLRWRPVTAGGFPHLSTKDDVYNNIFIPAGTNVHANQWAIHRDLDLYPDPESFNPERWLDPKYPTYREPLSTYPNLHNFSAFGFGRRICPGQNIAEGSLTLLTARIAWLCDLEPVKDEHGKSVLPGLYDYTAGFNVQPNWFPFVLTGRDVGRIQVLGREHEVHTKSDPLR